MITIKYEKGQEDKIIQKQTDKGLILSEVQNHTDGNFLIFITLEEWKDKHVRPERNKRLQESDIYMLVDNVEELKAEEKYEDMKSYRQALRDLPETITSTQFEWPVKPASLNLK